jgi:hypothetical protein
MEEELVFRLIFIGVFGVGLSISTYYRRLARKSGEAIARSRRGAGLDPARGNGDSVVARDPLLCFRPSLDGLVGDLLA